MNNEEVNLHVLQREIYPLKKNILLFEYNIPHKSQVWNKICLLLHFTIAVMADAVLLNVQSIISESSYFRSCSNIHGKFCVCQSCQPIQMCSELEKSLLVPHPPPHPTMVWCFL